VAMGAANDGAAVGPRLGALRRAGLWAWYWLGFLIAAGGGLERRPARPLGTNVFHHHNNV
jgi:hypothetical protein